MREIIIYSAYFLTVILLVVILLPVYLNYTKKRKNIKEEITKKDINLFLKFDLESNEITVNNIDTLDLNFGNIINKLESNNEFIERIKDYTKNKKNDDYTLSFIDKKHVRTLTLKFKFYNEEEQSVYIKCNYKKDYRDDKYFRLIGVDEFKKEYRDVSSGKGSVFYINVVDFNLINKRYGEKAGDYVLYVIKKRLQQFENNSKIPVYVGKDHYILYIDKKIKDKKIMKYAKKVLKEISKPIDIGGINIELVVNIGVSKGLYGNIDDFIHYAFLASEQCKKSNREIIICDKKLIDNEIANIHIKKELNKILNSKSMNLKYLPLYSFEKNHIVGYFSEINLKDSNSDFEKIKNYAVQKNSYEQFLEIYFKSQILNFLSKRPFKRVKLVLPLKLEDLFSFHNFLLSDEAFLGCRIILSIDVVKGIDLFNRKPQINEILDKLIAQKIEIALIIDENLFHDYEQILEYANYIIIDKRLTTNINENNSNKVKLEELINKAKMFPIEFIGKDVLEFLELEVLISHGIKLISGTYLSSWKDTPSEIKQSKTRKISILTKEKQE